MKTRSKSCLSLPGWLVELTAGEAAWATAEERMRFVIGLSRRNVEEGTGGPFAAAVFDAAGGRLVAAGVNRVEPEGSSIAHAEIMAILFAQKRIGAFDLGAGARRELVSSAQPCAMCFGAVLWSGVSRLVYAAEREDVESIVGFDEGPLPADWQRELLRRNISVQAGLLRGEAVEALRLYRSLGRTVYSPGH